MPGYARVGAPGAFSEHSHAGTGPGGTSSGTGIWTVIGVWAGDEPVPVGVIHGRHQVTGGNSGEFPDGLWATFAEAADADGAQAAAIEEMRGESGAVPARRGMPPAIPLAVAIALLWQ